MSNPFDASLWQPITGFEDLTDITYHRHVSQPTVRVAFDRPEVRNAQADPEAVLSQGKTRERVRMVELSAEDARPLLRQFPVLVPTGVSFMKNAGLVTGPHPDEFEALAGRCSVFRFDTV